MWVGMFVWCGAGCERDHPDQVPGRLCPLLCQVSALPSVLLPHVHFYGDHWGRPWAHLPTSSSQLHRWVVETSLYDRVSSIHGVISLTGPTYYRVRRRNPFPAELSPPSPSHEPVYSGNTGSSTSRVAPHSTFSPKSSSLYPSLPTDVNGTGGVPYSPPQQYPPATRPRQSGSPGEKTPLLQWTKCFSFHLLD